MHGEQAPRASCRPRRPAGRPGWSRSRPPWHALLSKLHASCPEGVALVAVALVRQLLSCASCARARGLSTGEWGQERQEGERRQ